jgi:hypothetical protein
MATAPELARVARAVLAHPNRAELELRIEATLDAIAPLDEDDLFASRTVCALLDDAGYCSVYAARPIACRGHVSFSREVCEAAYDGVDVDPDELAFDADPIMLQARTDADTRLATSLISAELDAIGYELHDGLVRALYLGPDRWLDADAFGVCRTVEARIDFDEELRELMDEMDAETD